MRFENFTFDFEFNGNLVQVPGILFLNSCVGPRKEESGKADRWGGKAGKEEKAGN